jgi:glycosyltransferase involved in cell wall biosynthesis
MLAEFGYNVDVIDYDENNVRLSEQYDLLIDIYPQEHAVYDGVLKKDCTKICLATGTEPKWQNKALAERLAGLKARKHISLPASALVIPFDDTIKSFDALLLFGNEFTVATFADLPIPRKYILKNAAIAFDNNPGYQEKLPQAFLYLATYPQVLKGLDLLLEVFARNPELYLFVCGQFREEKEFCKVYQAELFESTNIIPVGIIDITSNLFKRIAALCSYVVLPSCSEGMSGSVLTGMSAGLIPIVSRACGFDETDSFYFKDCSVGEIESTLKYFAAQDVSWVKKTSLKTVDVINQKYRPCHFTKSLFTALTDLLAK